MSSSAARAAVIVARAGSDAVWRLGGAPGGDVLVAHAGRARRPVSHSSAVRGPGWRSICVDAFAALMLRRVGSLGTPRLALLRRRAKGAAALICSPARLSGRRRPAGVRVLETRSPHLLIGLDDTEADARTAAQQALLVTGMGGLAMLGGLVLLGQQAGTFTISELLADPPSGTPTAVAVTLVLVGAFTKSAQYPFHSWLPGAMVAPTPISAYLHSAAMVKAGIYLVARLAPAFADVGIWRPLVVAVGLLTMLAGGLRALRPFDLKQLLAFGTISQLGFLMVLFGIGRPAATAAGCVVARPLVVHGGAVHGGRDRRLRDPHRTSAGSRRSGRVGAKAVALLSAADGGDPAVGRLHRRGAGVRSARRRQHQTGSCSSARRRLGAHRRLQPALSAAARAARMR